MKMKTLATLVGQFLNETIAPTLPVGILQGAISAASAMIAYRPDILQNACNAFPMLAMFGVIHNGEVDVPLSIVGIRGYFAKNPLLPIPVGGAPDGGKPPTYDLTADDGERFCTLLNNYAEAERQQNVGAPIPAASVMPPVATGAVMTPEQVLGTK